MAVVVPVSRPGPGGSGRYSFVLHLRCTRLSRLRRWPRQSGGLGKTRRKGESNVDGQAEKTSDSLPVTSSVPAELPAKQETLAREALIAVERGRNSSAGAG